MQIQDLRKKAIKPRRKKDTIVDWMLMSTNEVLERFASLPNAERIGKNEEQFVYIPGTRKDRVLLVAHADTVHKQSVELAYYNGYYFSNKDNVGIGADDRAGCNILWKLRNLGHSLLIPNAEEVGCKGSRFLMRSKEWAEEMSKHQFAMQFDRRHSKDLVTYRVGSTEFIKWLESQMTGYKSSQGSHTDICVLCDQDLHKDFIAPCAVNVSVGYYNEHTSTEYLNIREWNSTLSNTYNLLCKQDLPKFIQEVSTWRQNNKYSTGFHDHKHYLGSGPCANTEPIKLKDETPSEIKLDGILVCPECDGVFDSAELQFTSNNQCPLCSKEISQCT